MRYLTYTNCLISVSPSNNIMLVKPGVSESSEQDMMEILDYYYMLEDMTAEVLGAGIYTADITFEFSITNTDLGYEHDTIYKINNVKEIVIDPAKHD